MLDSVEKRMQDYKVPDSDKTEFQNLVLFAKNLTLKNTKKANENENKISEWLGSLILKYVDTRLSEQDVVDLLTFVTQYNSDLKELNTGLSAYDRDNLKVLFKSYLEDILNRNENTKLYKVDIGDINEDNNALNYVQFYVSKDDSKMEYQLDALPDADNDESISKLLSNKPSSIDTIRSLFVNAYNILRNKDYICIYQNTGISLTGEKYSADQVESESILRGDALIYFHLIINNSKFSGKINNISNNSDYSEFFIVYKEFNPLYRSICKSEMCECAFADIDRSIQTATIKDYSKIQENIDDSLIFRKLPPSTSILELQSVTNSIIFRDIMTVTTDTKTNEIKTDVKTTQRFIYLRSNPYIARRAAESEIIAYYVADPYQGNNYGQYLYERTEINNFLDIYKENRYYFYRVLLNRSFVNDTYYNNFEKLFLLYWSIERTMNKRASTITDINSYNKTDILNFFKSFGLEGMASLLESGDFMDSETISKTIIRRYVKLMQDKGSRDVIPDIRSIFKDYTLEISREVLIKDHNNNYNLYSIDANNNDVYKQITSGNKKIQTLESVTSKDEYWTEESTKRVYNAKYPSGADTKYLTASMSEDIYKAFIHTRITMCMVNYILDKYKDDLNEIFIQTSNDTNPFPGKDRLVDFIKSFELLLLQYYNLLTDGNRTAQKYSNVYYFNNDKLNELLTTKENTEEYVNDLTIYPDDIIKKYENLKDELDKYKDSNGTVNSKKFIDYLRNVVSATNSLIDSYDSMKNYENSDKKYDWNNSGFKYSNAIKLFDDIFISNDKKKSPLEYSLGNDTSESLTLSTGPITSVDACKSAISMAIQCLRSTFGIDNDINYFAIKNIENGQNLSSFVQYCITFFISYTVYLRDFQYLTVYNRPTETPISGDGLTNMTIGTRQEEYFYYDDSLEIEICN